jgi:hypothetical protein
MSDEPDLEYEDMPAEIMERIVALVSEGSPRPIETVVVLAVGPQGRGLAFFGAMRLMHGGLLKMPPGAIFDLIRTINDQLPAEPL